MPIIDPTILVPGDSIMYRPSSFIGIIIAVKSWSWTSHIEIYVGDGKSIGARAEGVDLYPLRNDKCVCGVLRPRVALNLIEGMKWFDAEAKGDKYNVSGLFSFYLPKQRAQPDLANYKREFCSQLADMFYVRCGFHAFSARWPASLIAPAQFWQSPLFDQIYPAS